MSPSMTASAAMAPHDAAHDCKPMFRVIASEEIKSEYLPSLVATLPYSMCQVGLAMTTLWGLEKKQSKEGVTDQEQSSCLEQKDDDCDGLTEQQHLRSIPFVSQLPGQSAFTTVYELTMAHAARICYITASSEERLGAALAACGVDFAKDNEEGIKDECMLREREAKIQADPFIQEQFRIFQTVAREIVRMLNQGVDAETAATPVHFFGVNRVWYRAVVPMYPVHREGPSIKFGITEKDLLACESTVHAEMQAIAEKKGWTVGPMRQSDAALMIEKNALKYDPEYASHVVERSICFRDQTGAMIAWAGTHQDLAVAALHVLPEYRKEGLGRLLLYYINLVQIKKLRTYLANTSQESVDPALLYMHADTEAANVPTQKFMVRCGYRIIGYDNWFTLTPVEKTVNAE